MNTKIVLGPNSLIKLFDKHVAEPCSYDVPERLCNKHGIYQFAYDGRPTALLKYGAAITLKAISLKTNIILSADKDGGGIIVLAKNDKDVRNKIMALSVDVKKLYDD
jgi:hypothetical protein